MTSFTNLNSITFLISSKIASYSLKMFDLLHVDTIACIISEWISDFNELVGLDTSLLSYCHREKYLLALKILNKVGQQFGYEKSPICSNETKLKTLVTWKENRGAHINKLELKVYTAIMDKVLLNFFPNLLSLTIDQKEAEFDLSLIAFGKSFPFLESLCLANLKKLFFDRTISSARYKPLELKELYLINNDYADSPENRVSEFLVEFAGLCQKLKKLSAEETDNNKSKSINAVVLAHFITKMIPELLNLEVLEFRCVKVDFVVPYAVIKPIENYRLSGNKLQSVKLSASKLNYDTDILVRMLAYYCNSMHITYLSLDCFHADKVTFVLLRNWIVAYGGNLEHFVLGVQHHIPSEDDEIEVEDEDEDETANVVIDHNSILQAIATTCQSLQILELKYFPLIKTDVIHQLFGYEGICYSNLHRLVFFKVQGMSVILDTLCQESAYYCLIDELVINDCLHFPITSLLNVIDIFELQELSVTVSDSNLVYEHDDEDEDEGPVYMFMEFMYKLMYAPNMQTIQTFTLAILKPTDVLFGAKDEKEMIRYWFFPFHELHHFTLMLPLNIDPFVIYSVLLQRIFHHCDKLQSFVFTNTFTDSQNTYDANQIHRMKNNLQINH